MATPLSDSEDPTQKRKIPWRPGVWTLLSFFLVVFGLYYFVRIQQKTGYYAERNLRILATVTGQIQDRIRQPEVVQTEGEMVWGAAQKRFTDSGSASLTLSEIVSPVFGQSFVKVFDAIMVLDHQGIVRFRDPAGICNASSLDEITEVRGLDKEVKLKTSDLQRRAQIARVILDGREYRLFSQPMPVLVGAPGQAGEVQWVVVGVVSRDRFTSESMTISYTLLITVVAVFLLLLFSVPFLKVSLLGSLQRVRFGDIVVLGVSLVCMTAVLTIVLFDLLAYRRTRAFSDAQLRHLASDIKRHVADEIGQARAVLDALEKTPVTPAQESVLLPLHYRALPAVRKYPFFESFFRIDSQGRQRQKWLMDSGKLPLPDVPSRAYFRDAMHGQGWRIGENDRYVIEALRSKTTGTTEAVLAKRARTSPGPENAVVALAFPMLSLIDTVIAGGCQFVVIDDRGNVMFHAEPQRNNAENFFEETDRSRALRSAVAGRQNEMLSLRYWGEDQRAFVTPIDGTPWTLVTFRSKRLLRTLNVETIMITVTFLLLYALAHAIVGILVAVSFPSYRAPWLWPDRRRGHVYRRLIGSYLMFSICFAVSIYLFRPRVLLVLAATVPALAILLTYMRLAHGGLMTWVAAGGALVALAISFAYISDGRVETDVMLPVWTLKLLVLSSGTAGVVLALLPKTEREEKAEQSRGEQALLMPTYTYISAGVGLLALMAIFPTAALYKAAYKIEIESFVKHGQLKLVQDIEERLQRLAQVQAQGWRLDDVYAKRQRSRLGIYSDFFFRTEINRLTPRNVVEAAIGRKLAPSEDLLEVLTNRALEREHDRNPIPRVIEWMLPQYSDYSIRMRELLHSESGDRRWTWRRDGGALTFASESIYGHHMVVRSVVPRLLPRYFGEPATADLPLGPLFEADVPDRRDVAWETDATSTLGRRALMAAAVVGYVVLIVLAVWFISRKVFLLDVRDPLWLEPTYRFSPALGNMLIFATDRATGLARVDRRQCIEVRLSQFYAGVGEEEDVWRRVFTEIDRQPSKGILVPDLESRLTDEASRMLKLRFLERAISSGRNVIAITTSSPWVLLDTVANDADDAPARWRALLAKFTVRHESPIAPPEQQVRETGLLRLIDRRKIVNAVKTSPEYLKGSVTQTKAVIRRETRGGDPFLHALGEELQKMHVGGQEEAYDEILDRAGEHYKSLWTGCSTEEKLVLSNLAADGFVNEKDRQVVRRLIARTLVCRDPNLRVMNETFRRFVLSEYCRRDLADCSAQVPVSTWDRIQKPLVVSLVMVAAFFFITQRELFDASFAMVTAVAGGLPAIMRMVGFFTDTGKVVPTAR